MSSVSHETAATPAPEPSSEVTISAVVCAYTDARRELLDNSIEAILAQLGTEDQLVVVIDYNDELFQRVAEQYGSRAKVVPNTIERGICGARNSGIAASSGSVIAFVDDDAQVQPGWLERLRANYHDPAVAGVGGHAQPVWPIERPPWFPIEFDWVVGCSHRGLPVSPTPVRNLLGCNMSFRRTALDSIGGFNSEIGQVGANLVRADETELCIRLRQKSPTALLVLDPGIKVRHWVSEDRTRPSYFLRRCFWEGISKQQLSTMVGPSDALSTESKYTFTVLPIAFARGLIETITSPGKRLSCLGQTAALVIGLGATTFGYVYSLVKSRFRRRYG